ncbi:MAG: imidazolonepropionase [Acidobacteriota bacterium]
MEKFAVTNIGQLVTIAGPPRIGAALQQLAILSNAIVICSDGKIEAVGTYDELAAQLDGITILDAGQRVVTPGLIDAHTHPVFIGAREHEYELRILGKSYQEIAAQGGGIRFTVRHTRAANEKELFQEARHHVLMMLAHGTTTAEAKSGYGLSLEDELKSLRTIKQLSLEGPVELIATFLGAHEIPDEYCQARESYLQLVIEKMLPAVVENGLARYCDIFCEDHVFSLAESRRVLTAAQACGLGLRIHADQLTLSGGARLAAEMSATTADHLEQIDSAGIAALRAAGVIPVLLPGSVFHLGLKKYPPARDLIEAGLAVVLATDFNPGSSPTPSLPMVMSIACTQMRMTPAETLAACTINAAYSLGLGEQIGSIEPGKQADLVIFNCQDYRQIPYFFGANLVHTVIKRGAVVHRGN